MQNTGHSMRKFATAFSITALLVLAGCGASETPDTTSEIDDFAARINGNDPSPAGSVAPTVVPPRENAAPGAYAPGTATDPQARTCNANKMGPFMGRVADDATRLEVISASAGAADVRFITPGSDFIRPDPTHPRLNIMLDNQGIIRDARCG